MSHLHSSAKTFDAQKISPPLYSICMANYNMADCLEKSLGSVLKQLTNEFEVVVLDDGSSDSSVEILNQTSFRYPQLKIFPYGRHPKRYLGGTRNLSVKHSTGKYLLLHIDCDDIWEPGIPNWCRRARKLSEIFDDDVFIAGKQINMVSRKLFDIVGGYRNIYYTEDRDLWNHLSAIKKLVFVEHDVFRTRMALAPKVRVLKRIKTIWNILLNDLRTGPSVLPRLLPTMISTVRDVKIRGLGNSLHRLIIFPLAAILALIKGPVEGYRPSLSASEWRRYKELNTKTFDEWMKDPIIR